MTINRKQYLVPWNKGKIVGQKAPLKHQEIWAIRIRLQLSGNLRDLALFNLAIDSKLRACDLLALRVGKRRPRQPCQFACDRDAAKDTATRAL